MKECMCVCVNKLKVTGRKVISMCSNYHIVSVHYSFSVYTTHTICVSINGTVIDLMRVLCIWSVLTFG